MENPLVTIGIPVYNEEEYLADTIKSALSQTYKNIEIIVTDNASSDRSLKIAEDIASYDERIVVISHKTNIGPFDNFKSSLIYSKGKYFTWLGAHDIMGVDYIEDAIYQLENDNDIAAIYPKVHEIKEGAIDKSCLINPDYLINPDNVSNRIVKIIKTTNRGSAFHSVFRKEILHQSFIKIDGGDLMLILTACSFGKLLPSKNIGINMRAVRSTETSQEQKKRYKSYGFSDNWEMVRYMYPFQLVSNLSKMRLKSRIALLRKVKLEMRRYKNESWRSISSFHIKKYKFKTAFLTFGCYVLEKLRY